ncbi:hypothetical protein ACLOJK_038529 [Asimina triloba]
MEDDDEVPPLAVEIEEPIDSNPSELPQIQPIETQDSVGVTVITGYLGAGKSTLVNFILNAPHGKKIALILNEFGEEIGVERAMVNEGDGGALVEEWVELANGCVCCTVKHSLVQALEQLIQRKESALMLGCHRLDHILLETTGLANPAPLASVLWLDDQLESSVKLDSIITVVDAKNLRSQLAEHRDRASFPEAFLQIAFADLVILNKIDLVSLEGSESMKSSFIEDLEKEIRNVNSLAKIIHSVRCQVDLCEIFDRGAYDAKEQVDLDKIRLWLEDILWERKYNMDVYRCKVCNASGSKGKLYVNSNYLEDKLNFNFSYLEDNILGFHSVFLRHPALVAPQGITDQPTFAWFVPEPHLPEGFCSDTNCNATGFEGKLYFNSGYPEDKLNFKSSTPATRRIN